MVIKKNHFRAAVSRTILVPGLIGATWFSCSGPGSVELEVDFSSRPQWHYVVEVETNGSIHQAEERRNFASTAHCDLRGQAAPDDPSDLTLVLADVHIVSDMLDSAETHNLRRQFEGTRMTFSCEDGTISLRDTSTLPRIQIGEWDLFRTFARVIPALPGSKVRPGSTWGRERQIPLKTTHGDALGHLFQSFLLDSLSRDSLDNVLAHISWEFSYRVEILKPDDLGLLTRAPQMGSGTGYAVFNTTKEYLLESSIVFTVPRQHQPKLDISWTEEVRLALAE